MNAKFSQVKELTLSSREQAMLLRIGREGDPIFAPRAIALLQFSKGRSRSQIAKQAQVTGSCLYQWVEKYERRRAQGRSVRESIHADVARVMSGQRLPLRRLLEASRMSKDWTIAEMKAFFAKQGLKISTGSAWNYKNDYGRARKSKQPTIGEHL